jgi:hypothetical protein
MCIASPIFQEYNKVDVYMYNVLLHINNVYIFHRYTR